MNIRNIRFRKYLAGIFALLCCIGCFKKPEVSDDSRPSIDIHIGKAGAVSVNGQPQPNQSLSQRLNTVISNRGYMVWADISAEPDTPFNILWPTLVTVREAGLYSTKLCDPVKHDKDVVVFIFVPEIDPHLFSGIDNEPLTNSIIMLSHSGCSINGEMVSSSRLGQRLAAVDQPSSHIFWCIPNPDYTYTDLMRFLVLLQRSGVRAINITASEHTAQQSLIAPPPQGKL